LRRQLKVLKGFIDGLPLVRMRPDDAVIKKLTVTGPGVRGAAKAAARALVEPGKTYAVYVNAGPRVELALTLPAGEYAAQWVDTTTGRAEAPTRFAHAGGDKSLVSPPYSEDVALSVRRLE
jgi:hypothetical protein